MYPQLPQEPYGGYIGGSIPYGTKLPPRAADYYTIARPIQTLEAPSVDLGLGSGGYGGQAGTLEGLPSNLPQTSRILPPLPPVSKLNPLEPSTFPQYPVYQEPAPSMLYQGVPPNISIDPRKLRTSKYGYDYSGPANRNNSFPLDDAAEVANRFVNDNIIYTDNRRSSNRTNNGANNSAKLVGIPQNRLPRTPNVNLPPVFTNVPNLPLGGYYPSAGAYDMGLPAYGDLETQRRNTRNVFSSRYGTVTNQ